MNSTHCSNKSMLESNLLCISICICNMYKVIGAYNWKLWPMAPSLWTISLQWLLYLEYSFCKYWNLDEKWTLYVHSKQCTLHSTYCILIYCILNTVHMHSIDVLMWWRSCYLDRNSNNVAEAEATILNTYLAMYNALLLLLVDKSNL